MIFRVSIQDIPQLLAIVSNVRRLPRSKDDSRQLTEQQIVLLRTRGLALLFYRSPGDPQITGTGLWEEIHEQRRNNRDRPGARSGSGHSSRSGSSRAHPEAPPQARQMVRA